MNTKKVLITGGAGYVGSALVPQLLAADYEVTVYDLMIYGEDVIDGHPNLTMVKADLRDQKALAEALKGQDAVIHLACISNDPSVELDPTLGKSINLDAFRPLVELSREAGVKRFVYASSSSVYGIKEEPNVTEDLPLQPLTDYSRFKADCEEILAEYQSPDFTTFTVRPATVCGYSRRQRLDVVVNILTNLAFHKRKISVFGGDQLRPNIHIQDMIDLYQLTLELPAEQIAGKVLNAGYENHSVLQLAETVRDVVGEDVELEKTPSDDNRSYHISSAAIERELGFVPKHTIREAMQDLVDAFEAGKLPNSLEDPRYFNVKMMKLVDLK